MGVLVGVGVGHSLWEILGTGLKVTYVEVHPFSGGILLYPGAV